MLMPARGMIRSLGGTGGERLAAEPKGVNRLDDRDLDDLALGRGDLPALAWRHAQSA